MKDKIVNVDEKDIGVHVTFNQFTLYNPLFIIDQVYKVRTEDIGSLVFATLGMRTNLV